MIKFDQARHIQINWKHCYTSKNEFDDGSASVRMNSCRSESAKSVVITEKNIRIFILATGRRVVKLNEN